MTIIAPGPHRDSGAPSQWRVLASTARLAASGTSTTGTSRVAPRRSTSGPAARLAGSCAPAKAAKQLANHAMLQPFDSTRCTWWKKRPVIMNPGAMIAGSRR